MSYKYISIKNFYLFLKDLIRFRNFVLELARKDFTNRYLGSYLGIIWGFVQPWISIIIMWFVFQVGFKSQPVDNFPFILWLMCGMIPWFFLSESINGATGSILEYSYMVKKIVFRISVLPIIKILSSLYVHLVFIIFLFIMFFIYKYIPTIYNLQILYYIIASIAFVLGLSWITASLMVFLKDVGPLVTIVLQLFFWLTPIFWSFSTASGTIKKFIPFLKLNPIYYIVEGFRDSFIYQKWFWEHPLLTVYFWGLTLLLWIFGTIVFKRLRPHFADVL